jgi:hypothetical protein
MDKAQIFSQIVIFTLVNTRMENLKAKDNILGKMGHFILESLKTD